MLLRSSSTPMLGSLMAESPNSGHHHNQQQHHFYCCLSPLSDSSPTSSGVRRTRSDGNLHSLLSGNQTINSNKHPQDPQQQLQEEDEEEEDEVEVEVEIEEGDKKVLHHEFSFSGGNKQGPLFLARGLGIDRLGSGMMNYSAGGERSEMEMYYKKMVDEDPSNALVLSNYAQFLYEAEHVLLLRHTVPVIWWKLKRLLKVGSEKKMSMAKKVIDSFIEDAISNKRENCTTKSDDDEDDLLTMYMKSLSHEDGWRAYFESDKYFLIDTLLTVLAAGKDTITAALTWFFWLVTMNPQAESKIVEELGQHRVIGDVEELVYLQAALYESLRLFPSVPFTQKSVSKADILPTGHRVLPGTMVIVPIYAMGRMKSIWGDDCMEYKPERWITEEGKLRHEPSNKFLSFNCGPRTCLGKTMSFMQMKVVAAAVISRFRFQLVEGHVVKPKLSIVLSMKDGLMVKVVKRS